MRPLSLSAIATWGSPRVILEIDFSRGHPTTDEKTVDALFNWVSQFGYPALFSLLMLGIVGLPIPDETLLTFAGYLVFKNELNLIPTLATAFLGSSCG